jgi:Integrase zinc binding domain
MLCKDGKLCVPMGKLRQTLMHDAHDSIVAGNLGIDKTIASIRKRFEWGGMSKDIAEYVRVVTDVNEISLLHQTRLAYYNRWKFPTETGSM